MPKEYFAKKGKSRSGGGPFMMGSYGKGKNPVPMLGDLDKDGKMSGYESKRQAAIEKNTKGGPKMKYGSPMDMYGKKGTMATKKGYAPGQLAAIHASKAEKKKRK
tara:strand:- start:491 stop:805 length:315 start_codon:yes stop_codon:yes gene_type:complete